MNTSPTQPTVFSFDEASVVTRKGQITIPAAIRRQLGIKIGDRVALWVEPDKTVTLSRLPLVTEQTFGAVKPLPQQTDAKRLRQAFIAHMGRERATPASEDTPS